MTDHSSDNNEFSLNKFDIEDDTPAGNGDFFDDDLFNEMNLDSDTGEQEEFGETYSPGYSRKEPAIISHDDQPPLSDPVDTYEPVQTASPFANAAETAPIQKPVAPPMEDDQFSNHEDPDKGSRTRLATTFAVVALLLAGFVVWLNLSDDSSDQQGREKTVNFDARLQTTDTQLKAADAQVEELKKLLNSRINAVNNQQQHFSSQIEQMEDQQQKLKNSFNSKIAKLQEELNKLNNRQQQFKKPQPVKAVAPAIKVKKPRVTQNALPAPITSADQIASRPATESAGWVINLLSVDNKETANKEAQRLNNLGIAATVATTSIKGKLWYRVRLEGFADREDAAARKKELSSKHGIKDAWVHKP